MLPPRAPSPAPLSSVHTSNLPALFAQARISLAVSTYQAGKLVLMRSEGDTLNTHFRAFDKPMGISIQDGRLAVGCSKGVYIYRDVPDVARGLAPPDKHDACFVLRSAHITGNIDIHELQFGARHELWAVNTRFSCLCTLDADHSFVPRWRPPFVSGYAPEDRCHLNGFALVDGAPRYATALGDTNTADGWRERKRDNGVLLDIAENRILLSGLSMPHSPRWHQGKLYFLESGEGSLAEVDLERGTHRTIARLPGFTRGLDFLGPLAFIGLSQVRESAVFGGLPVLDRIPEPNSGVWVVRLDTGAVVGFLRFEAEVREIFAVEILRGIRFPELLELDDPHVASTYVLPDEALKQVERRTRP